MKRLVLITKRNYALEMYLAEIQKLFDGYLEITGFSTEKGIGEIRYSMLNWADIVVVTSPYSFPFARDYMKETAEIVNLNFAFSKEKIEFLKSFPVGTNALVCFNYYAASHQAAFSLNECGVKNLNVFIDYPQNPNVIDVKMDIAITSGITDKPPKTGIIVDMGERKIAFSTVLEIAVKANILDDGLEKRIYEFFADSSMPDDCLSHVYTSSAIFKHQLQTITNCIDYGILILNNDYHVMSYNKHFTDMFHIAGDISDISISNISQLRDICDKVVTCPTITNELFTLDMFNKNIMISKMPVSKNYYNSAIYIVLFKDITDVMNLESSLHKQLSSRGHIAKYNFMDIAGNSEAIRNCISKAKKIATLDKTTLIIGDSGTGKEMFAQSIHNESSRSKYPFVAINCAAISSNLLESELFGYEDGAFTGAKKGGKTGLFQMAHKGTIFLDEIGEISMDMQMKLLRVLEEHEIMRVGSGEITPVDVRVIAATNKDLVALVKDGSFRMDLFYRLNTLILRIPTLRERASDIPLLISLFLKNENLKDGTIDRDVMDFFFNYSWPGNIRELKNCVTYMVSIADGMAGMQHLPDYITVDDIKVKPARVIDDEVCEDMLKEKKSIVWHIANAINQNSKGRRNIQAFISEKGFDISEYALRRLLEEMQGEGKIIIQKGRGGCLLTPKGKEYFKL